ncbi:hypothetical protein BDR26DRAFT_852139 [Obelidium mucronatum]|nr:hypothetical protein BDR26DRAFT_852139 [Obelidium mucronatum]
MTSGQSLSVFCTDDTSTPKYCAIALRDNPLNQLTVSVYAAAAGWAAIGTGSKMQGSTMFVAWPNGNKTVTSLRKASGESQPQPTESNAVSFTSIHNPLPERLAAWNPPIIFSFNCSANNTAIISTVSSSQFIYAWTDSPPFDQTDSLSSFPQHSNYGGLVLDVSKLGSETVISPGAIHVDLVLLHAALMFVAWGILPWFAIFIARYLKSYLGHAWYLSHKWIMVGVGVLTIAGLVAIELHVVEGTQRFISSTHGIIGTVISFILFPVQGLLGFICNKLWDPKRTKVPWWDLVHRGLGFAIMVLVLAQVQLGLTRYGVSTGLVVAWWLWVALLIIASVWLGEFWLNSVSKNSQSSQLELESIDNLPSSQNESQQQLNPPRGFLHSD